MSLLISLFYRFASIDIFGSVLLQQHKNATPQPQHIVIVTSTASQQRNKSTASSWRLDYLFVYLFVLLFRLIKTTIIIIIIALLLLLSLLLLLHYYYYYCIIYIISLLLLHYLYSWNYYYYRNSSKRYCVVSQKIYLIKN